MKSPRYPDLLCIGAQKAATSWLYEVLRHDPRVVLPPVKELHYFSQLHQRNASHYGPEHREAQVAGVHRWFDSHPERRTERTERYLDMTDRAAERAVDDFWYASFFESAGPRTRCVDICPDYLNMPDAGVAHAVALLPDTAQYLVLVRDPVDRAFSQIRMHIARGTVPRDMAALASGEQTLYPFLFHSDYQAAITRWETFAGADRLHCVLYDDIIADPEAVIGRICAIMGLDPGPATPRTFERVFEGEAIDIPPALRARLLDELQPQYEFLAPRFPEAVAAWRARHAAPAGVP